MKSFAGKSVKIVSDKTSIGLVAEIASKPDQEEPFFVADLADVVYKFKLWKLKLPRVQPFYAVKCNDCPVVLHLLAALGLGFDCASKNEIQQVLEAGVEPSRIIYANPCKTRSFIKHASSVGVDLMTFDNEMELHKVKAFHPSARLVIRIGVDDSSAVCRLGIKFGCNLEAVPHLLKIAKELELNVVGVSFHVGSGCQDSTAYSKAIVSARHAFNIGEEMGFHFSLLDIGGGYPGDRGSQFHFEEIAHIINSALDQYFPAGCGVQLISEPGRYFVSSAFTLCTNIIAKRELAVDENGDPGCMYYLNDGVYGSFNCLIFDHAEVNPVPLLESFDRKVLRSSLWGPTCDSMDRIMETCYLPNMNVGEWLVFENMGAYTIAAASTFNGFQKPSMTFLLPRHVLAYLKQLSSWPQLMKIMDLQVDVRNLETSSIDTLACHALPVPEPIFA